MRTICRAGWAFALLASTAFPVTAQEVPAEPAVVDPQPFARARLEPGDSVTVGQPVTVVVEVLTPSFFTGAPRFPALDVGDAITIFEDRGINFTEKIDGLTWSGQSRNYKIYPQRSGEFVVDAVPVRVRYFSDSGGARTEATVSPPPVSFEAVYPPEAENLQYFISTTGLAIEQSFDREPDTLVVGEAFVRTVTITVEDALSMVIPPLEVGIHPGLAIYSDPPEIRDEGGERGEQLVGTRIERTTYVAEQAGDYRLSPVELLWWDVGSKRMRTATLPALEVHVEPNPDLVAEIPLPPEDAVKGATRVDSKARVSLFDLLRRWGPPLALTTFGLLLLFRLWRRFEPALHRRLSEARVRRRNSEAVYFERFKKAALSGEPRTTWNAWTAWLDRIHSGPGAATVQGFVESAGDPDLDRELETLEALLFGREDTHQVDWSGRSLRRSVARVRRRLRLGARPRPGMPGRLNPGRSRLPAGGDTMHFTSTTQQ